MTIERDIFTVIGQRCKPVSEAFLTALKDEPMIERHTYEDIKKAQSLRLTQTPFDFSNSVFREAQNVVDQLDLEKELGQMAQNKGYESIMDFAFCSLYPEKEKECRNYYEGKGKQISQKYSKKQIRQWDNIIAQALFFLYKQMQGKSDQ